MRILKLPGTSHHEQKTSTGGTLKVPAGPVPHTLVRQNLRDTTAEVVRTPPPVITPADVEARTAARNARLREAAEEESRRRARAGPVPLLPGMRYVTANFARAVEMVILVSQTKKDKERMKQWTKSGPRRMLLHRAFEKRVKTAFLEARATASR